MSRGSRMAAAMSAVVAASVRTTVRRMPARSATWPQTSLPAAPPAKTSARAWPIVAIEAPFSTSRKGR